MKSLKHLQKQHDLSLIHSSALESICIIKKQELTINGRKEKHINDIMALSIFMTKLEADFASSKVSSFIKEASLKLLHFSKLSEVYLVLL